MVESRNGSIYENMSELWEKALWALAERCSVQRVALVAELRSIENELSGINSGTLNLAERDQYYNKEARYTQATRELAKVQKTENEITQALSDISEGRIDKTALKNLVGDVEVKTEGSVADAIPVENPTDHRVDKKIPGYRVSDEGSSGPQNSAAFAKTKPAYKRGRHR